ncbi:MAG: cytidylate kinase-like family protein [Bacteroidales bacterium]|nr:cytidylate kinase-like family protein [Bacteroidales bacterium]
MLNEPFVITINREAGSGGRTVGRILAQKLGVRYCDKDLIKALREKFNLTTEAIEKLKGEKTNWLNDFFQFVFPAPPPSAFLPQGSHLEFRADVTSDAVFAAEAEILRELVEEGSCVIAGRSAFFVTEGCPNKVDIFIRASEEHRITRLMEKQELTREQAQEVIQKVDAARETYVSRHTGSSRYNLNNYDLVLNMDTLSEEQAVDIILAYLNA